MEKVSSYEGHGTISSKYFDYSFKKLSNKDLNRRCGLLYIPFACVDIRRDNEQITDLKNVFMDALLSCKNEDDIKDLDSVMQGFASIGGYAAEFYDENKHLITINEVNKRKLPVSSIKQNGNFDSKYLHYNYQIFNNTNNNLKLQNRCKLFLKTAVYADILRNEKVDNMLMQDFLKMIESCDNENDKKELKTFMRELENIGGYIVDFYLKNGYLEIINKDEASHRLNSINEEEKEKIKRPVSRIIDDKIESQYFNIKTINMENKKLLKDKVKKTIIAMAMADVKRTEETMSDLKICFLSTLLTCKTEHEVEWLYLLMAQESTIGGIATQFWEENSHYINSREDANVEFEKMIQQYQERQKNSKKNNEEEEQQERIKNMKIAEFNEEFKKLNKTLEVIKDEFRMASEEDIENLIRKYRALNDDFIYVQKYFDKNYIIRVSLEIEERLLNLKKLLELKEEERRLENMFDEFLNL